MPALTAGLTLASAATPAGTTAAAGSSFLQPWMVPLLTSAASSLYRAVSPDRAMQIRDKVLNSQIEMRNMIARRAFGDFTSAEAANIKRGAAHQVNAVAANVSARGLGSSGAGAQIISEAQQAPFYQAQQQALSALPVLDQALWQSSADLLMNDGSFFDDLREISSLLAQEVDTNPEAANDPEIYEMVRKIYLLLQKPPQ